MVHHFNDGPKRLNAPISPTEFQDDEVDYQRCRALWVAKLNLYARAILCGKGGYLLTYEDAIRWLDAPDFRLTCEMIGLEPSVIRKRLLSAPKDPKLRKILQLHNGHRKSSEP